MTTIMKRVQSPLHYAKLANGWILSFILLTALLFTAPGVWASFVSGSTLAHGSDASSLGNAPLVVSNLTPTAPATATAAAPATATRISESRAAQTTTNTSTTATTQITVKVSGYFVNLRTGPDVNFAKVRKLTFGERVILVGRLGDNSWLYMKTSDGLDGWVTTTMVDLAANNVETLPVKTRPASEMPTLAGKVYGNSVNLRTTPDVDAVVVGKLTYGEELTLLGRLRNNIWLYVKTSDGLEGWVHKDWVDMLGRPMSYLLVKTAHPRVIPAPVPLVGLKGHSIDIDLGDQMLYAFDGDKLVNSFLVSTGTTRYPTKTGLFHVYAKIPFIDMQGSDYYLPNVPSAMFYEGDFSIHGTYWHHNFGTRMSHGCINMDIKDAEWLYNWSQIGTIVYVHW